MTPVAGEIEAIPLAILGETKILKGDVIRWVRGRQIVKMAEVTGEPKRIGERLDVPISRLGHIDSATITPDVQIELRDA